MAHILVIDDDPGVREMLRLVLTAEGYEVRAAADGVAGIASVKESPPSLVILDVSMPGASGTEVLESLRRLHPGLPVFFLTVYGDFSDRTELDAADCCFVKSADLTPLLKAVARTLGPEPSAAPCPDRRKRLRAQAPRS